MTLVDPTEKSNSIANSERDNITSIQVKTPKRILHFSDGILEEYSDDDKEPESKVENELIDPSKLTWIPWFMYKTVSVATQTLNVIDTVGEYMAEFFGITSPKYYFELEEYKRQQAELLKEKEQEKGWSQSVNENMQLNEITEQPHCNHTV